MTDKPEDSGLLLFTAFFFFFFGVTAGAVVLSVIQELKGPTIYQRIGSLEAKIDHIEKIAVSFEKESK